MNPKTLITTLLCLGFLQCGKNYTPKPKGELRLEYSTPTYQPLTAKHCPFVFEYSVHSNITEEDSACWHTIHYPNMQSYIHLTYQSVNNDLAKKIKESERLTHEHSIKASYIAPKTFTYPQNKVYGTLFELGGQTAVNYQFHVTDSLQHLLIGSVYFKVAPNPDSLGPAIDYIHKDVQHLIETIQWK